LQKNFELLKLTDILFFYYIVIIINKRMSIDSEYSTIDPMFSRKTYVQLQSSVGLPSVRSGNVSPQSIPSSLKLVNDRVREDDRYGLCTRDLPESVYRQQYTNFVAPVMNYKPLIDAIGPNETGCGPYKNSDGDYKCLKWESSDDDKQTAWDAYRNNVFPSEFKYLTDWNDSQWGAYLVFIYERDLDSTLKFLEAVDNDVQQHIFATPVWDDAWKDTTSSIKTTNDKYTPLTVEGNNEDNPFSWMQLPKFESSFPSFDHRNNWRKIYRYIQKDNRSTWLPKDAEDSLLGDDSKYVTNVLSNEGYKNKPYDGNGNWADLQPYGKYYRVKYGVEKSYDNTINMLNQDFGPINTKDFTGYRFYDQAGLNSFPGQGRTLTNALRTGGTRVKTNMLGQPTKQVKNDSDIRKAAEKASKMELCRLHIFDRYCTVSDYDFKLDHYGISKQIWTQMILDDAFEKRKEFMIGTAYQNLIGRFQNDQSYKECKASFLQKYLGGKAFKTLDVLGKLTKIVSKFMSITAALSNIYDQIDNLIESETEGGAMGQNTPSKSITEYLTDKKLKAKIQNHSSKLIDLASNPGLSENEMKKTSKSLGNLLSNDDTSLPSIHSYYNEYLNPAMQRYKDEENMA